MENKVNEILAKKVLRLWKLKGNALKKEMRQWLESESNGFEAYLVENGIEQKELNALYSADEHKDNIKAGLSNYTPKKIKSLLDEGIIEEAEYAKIISDIHKAKINDGKYSIEDIKNAAQSGEFSQTEANNIIADIHRNKITNNEYSIDEIKVLGEKGELPQAECSDIITNMHKAKVQRGEYSPSQLRDLKDNNEISEELYSKVIRDLHLRNIKSREYSDGKIEMLIQQREIKDEDLYGILPDSEIDLKFKIEIQKVDFQKWTKDLPPPSPNRTDVFILGIPASGKTTFMSGLLYYAKRAGKLFSSIKNVTGKKYLDLLTRAVSTGSLVQRTSHEAIQHMECDFIDERGNHPLTFIEMSGEIFKEFYGEDAVSIPEKLNAYMTNQNRKIISFVVDYEKESTDTRKRELQQDQLEHAIHVLHEVDVLKQVDAISILITKWDMSPDQSPQAAVSFLKENGYLSLKTACEQYQSRPEYNFEFSTKTFSLGEFSGFNNQKYQYNEKDSKKLFDWFCEKSAWVKGSAQKTKPKGKKGGFLGGLFGS